MSWIWGNRNDDDDDEDEEDEYSSYYTESSASADEDDDGNFLEGESAASFGNDSNNNIDNTNNNKNNNNNGTHEEGGGGARISRSSSSSSGHDKEETDQQQPSNNKAESDDEGCLRNHELVELLQMHQQPDGDEDIKGDDEEDEDDELLQSGTIPVLVMGNNSNSGNKSRERLPSGMSSVEMDDMNDPANESQAKASTAIDDHDDDEQEDDDEEDEEVTSIAEKQSLLLLAAENDRVDILQAILSSSSSNHTSSSSSNNEDNETERQFLLNPVTRDGVVTTIPPLHVAVSYGSVHTINCLLRLGANPSLRPNVAVIRALQTQQQQQPQQQQQIPHMQRFDGWSAWELAFGKQQSPHEEGADVLDTSQSGGSNKKSSGWLFKSRSSGTSLDDSRSGSSIHGVVALLPSKQESIRHAFTAEALRCVGADEVERLRQLLDAGMPANIEIGHQSLLEWAVDLTAEQCQNILQQQSQSQSHDANGSPSSTTPSASTDPKDDPPKIDSNGNPTASSPRKTAVLNRGDGDGTNTNTTNTVAALTNRLEELTALARALSQCLDNLAEEVSVCAGLLLVGSGAAALASHVRTLKATQQRQRDEWQLCNEAWEQIQDELAYWMLENKQQEQEPQQQSFDDDTTMDRLSHNNDDNTNNNDDDTVAAQQREQQQQQQQQQLTVQIGAMEHKIRMLRASIADLSEENVRTLAEVERRGLSGGIALVRGLRQEIRDMEFELSEVKGREAACRLLQARRKAESRQPNMKTTLITTTSPNDGGVESRSVTDSIDFSPEDQEGEYNNGVDYSSNDNDDDDDNNNIPDSERIATGQSRALIVRPTHHDYRRGFLPYHLWRMFLRIMGLTDDGTEVWSTSSLSTSSRRHRDAAPSSATPIMIL